ncbi:MAG: hypothetical protein JOZ38_06930, partial [Candidatus Eremiobacteraeota bacterium]|nr:hypothetical protein [Candidatus Eremiobacteraeota bacterium]
MRRSIMHIGAYALAVALAVAALSFRAAQAADDTTREILAHCAGCDFARVDWHGRDLHGVSVAGADL